MKKLLALLTLTLLCSTVDAQTPLRIMAYGDDLTVASNVPGSYRAQLHQYLTLAGVAPTFVGPFQAGPPEAGNHAGLAGLTVVDAHSYYASLHFTYWPQVVLLLVGTEELRARTDVSNLLQEYEGAVLQMWIQAPNVLYVLGSPPGAVTQDAAYNARLDQFAVGVAEIADRLRSAGLPVRGADLHGAVLSFDADGWHPDAAGYGAAAWAWLVGLSD